jgi:hypothetical protein
MIYDATVKVTCDNRRCNASVLVDLKYLYRTMDESSGYYDSSDLAVGGSLIHDHDWIVRDGKHYCDADCADADK